jgi:hypothetical protein
MTPETLMVPRAEIDMEEPWATPAACKPVRLRCATDAAVPRLATSVTAWYDDACLNVLFSGSDDYLESTYFEHDAPLYEQDVVEVFLAPERPSRYYELEVSPRGTIFDAAIESPEGVRATMTVDRDWNCEGLVAAVRRVTESDGTTTIDTLLRIPFASLGAKPSAGAAWRANFFRIDRHPEHGDEFTAWQPTMKQPADFHVTAAFGTIVFGG